jgi:hypothetical protein
MEKSKLGESSLYEDDLFSPPSTEEKIYFDDTIPPIYDDYNDEYDICSPPTIEEKISCDYNMPPIFDDYGDENLMMIAILLNLIPLRLLRMTMFMWGVLILLCMWLGVKTERIRTDSSETAFVTILFLDSESERIVCGYEYGIGVYR